MLRRTLVALPLLAAGCAEGVDPPAETKAVFIEGGEFTMGGSDLDPCDNSKIVGEAGLKSIGCQDARVQSEALQHQVEVRAFCIDEHEVTIDQYRHCVARDECSDPKATNAGDTDDDRSIGRYYRNHDKYGSFPVLGVTVEQAREFCAFHGGRLPTEVEWEFAARSRGATGRDVFVWEGDNPVAACSGSLGEVAYGTCVDGRPQRVGAASRDVTAQGVKDMAGNAQEWVADEFSFFAYCAADQGGAAIGDLYETVNVSSFRRKPAANADVPTQLVQDPSCVDACVEDFNACTNVCSKAWRGDPTVAVGQRKWGEEHEAACRSRNPGLPDEVDCAACAGDATCEAYCACVESGSAGESGGECVQTCIADTVTCETQCAGPDDVARACINVSTTPGQNTSVPQPICRVRGGAAPFEATAPVENTGGPLDGIHVVRGGHFQESAACGVRTTRREARKGTDPSPFIGFRCAYDAGSERCR
jgi:formylglycine-generating enzyme required for sulfatase activity